MSEYIATEFDLASTEFLSEYEEIVRCRDCKYASAGEAVISGNWQHGNCHNPRYRGSLHVANARADGFCAWSERRDADNASD